jgi:hypothetical protein
VDSGVVVKFGDALEEFGFCDILGEFLQLAYDVGLASLV